MKLSYLPWKIQDLDCTLLTVCSTLACHVYIVVNMQTCLCRMLLHLHLPLSIFSSVYPLFWLCLPVCLSNMSIQEKLSTSDGELSSNQRQKARSREPLVRSTWGSLHASTSTSIHLFPCVGLSAYLSICQKRPGQLMGTALPERRLWNPPAP